MKSVFFCPDYAKMYFSQIYFKALLGVELQYFKFQFYSY